MQDSPNTNTQSWLKTGLLAGLLFVLISVSVFALITYQSRLKPLTDDDLPAELQQHYLIGTKTISGMDMTDHTGQPFTEARFKGHWTFVFFGFVNCPDVCPTTMLVMQQVWKKLPDAAKADPKPQLLFISVDPERDTQDKLASYVTFYHPEFIGARANHDKLDAVVRQFGALYGYEDGTDKDNYTVLHSAQVLLVDPQGNMRAIFSSPLDPDKLTNTFVRIREFHKG